MAQSLYNAFDTFYRKQKATTVQGTETSDNSDNSDNSAYSENAERSDNARRYAIQICASKEKLPKNDPKLKGIDAQYFKQNNYYKYYCYPSASRDSVALYLPEVKRVVSDAWIIRLP